MSLSKQRISSPLEAGRSILDAHNLPPHLMGALEYASKRLARKALHITLVVVRNEYQLPSSTSPCATPSSPPPTPETTAGFASPARFTSPVAGLRQLVRRGTSNSLTSTASSSTISETAPSTSTSTSPTFPPPPTEPLASPRRWATLPPTPGSPPPRTPMTPHTPSSTATTTTTSSSSASSASQGPNNTFGIRLIYTGPLTPRAEKTLRATIAKAERKFRTGTGWLPAATTATACGLNADLVRRSLVQNEVLFSSDGLTLLGLDRVYTFKAALAAYARSTSAAASASPSLSSHPVAVVVGSSCVARADSTRIEDAVDSLRRLVLANGGRPVSRADLHRCYEWLGGVNARALGDVERMYRRAYGGPGRSGAFEEFVVEGRDDEVDNRESRSSKKNSNSRGGEEGEEKKKTDGFKIGTPPPPKSQSTPVLKLDTNIVVPKVVRPKPRGVPPAVEATDGGGSGIIGSSGEGRGDEKTQKKANHQQQRGQDIEIRIDDLADADGEEEEEEDGDRTARPVPNKSTSNNRLSSSSPFWPLGAGASIDELLSPCDARSSQQLGPMTPNGYDDISPITRGEWGFLFKGDGWKGGKTAAVETC